MLSDEERKAIDLLEEYLYFGNKEGVLCRNLRTISTIIEKQSKEIEELKAINSIQKYRIEVIDERELISKDKIKAKIEEYHHKDFIKMQVCMKHDEEALKIEEVLQSLLEEKE